MEAPDTARTSSPAGRRASADRPRRDRRRTSARRPARRPRRCARSAHRPRGSRARTVTPSAVRRGQRPPGRVASDRADERASRAPSRASQRAAVAAEPPCRNATRPVTSLPSSVARRGDDDVEHQVADDDDRPAAWRGVAATRGGGQSGHGGGGHRRRHAARESDRAEPHGRDASPRGTMTLAAERRAAEGTRRRQSARRAPRMFPEPAMTLATGPARPARHRHHPDAGDRRRPAGELGPSGCPDGHGPDGLHAVDPLPPPRPDATRTGRTATGSSCAPATRRCSSTRCST